MLSLSLWGVMSSLLVAGLMGGTSSVAVIFIKVPLSPFLLGLMVCNGQSTHRKSSAASLLTLNHSFMVQPEWPNIKVPVSVYLIQRWAINKTLNVGSQGQYCQTLLVLKQSHRLKNGHNFKTFVLAKFCRKSGANFMSRLKLSQLSLCVKFKPKFRLKSVHDIGPSIHKGWLCLSYALN